MCFGKNLLQKVLEAIHEHTHFRYSVCCFVVGIHTLEDRYVCSSEQLDL